MCEDSVHYSLDLFTLDAREFLVTDINTGERLSNFTDIKKGEIVVGDRAYGNMPGCQEVRRGFRASDAWLEACIFRRGKKESPGGFPR